MSRSVYTRTDEDTLAAFHREATADRVKLFELVWGANRAPARAVWQPSGAGYVAIWVYDAFPINPTLSVIPKRLPVVNDVARPWPQPLIRAVGDEWVNRGDRFTTSGWFAGRRNAETTISCLITDLGLDGATSYRALRAVLANSDFIMPSDAGPMAINPSYAAFTTS